MRRYIPRLTLPSPAIGDRIAGNPVGFPSDRIPTHQTYDELGFLCQFRHHDERFPFASPGDTLFVFLINYSPVGFIIPEQELAGESDQFVFADGEGYFPGFAVHDWTTDDDGVEFGSDRHRRLLLDTNDDSYPILESPSIFFGGAPPEGMQPGFYPGGQNDRFLGAVSGFITEDFFRDSDVTFDSVIREDILHDEIGIYPRNLNVATCYAGFWIAQGELRVTGSY
jgi:hypothetical protein